jgi:hypothetical protein
MAEAFGIGAGAVGVLGLAIQITQIVVQFGLDWKHAPTDAKEFMVELKTLSTVLTGTTNMIINPDFVYACQTHDSLLKSELEADSVTSTQQMLEACRVELSGLLVRLQKIADGSRIGWERLKGAFLTKDTREAVENLHRQCQILNDMLSVDMAAVASATYKEVKEGRQEQQEWHQSEQDQEILRWLSKVDHDGQHNHIFLKREESTGQWLLDSAEFKKWIAQRGQIMFCPGIPGAGKSVMASIVVDHLFQQYRNRSDTGVAHVYFNFQRISEQEIESLLRSLLYQLLRKQTQVPESVRAMHKKYQNGPTRPSPAELSGELLALVAGYSHTFIILDALDECQKFACKVFLEEMFRPAFKSHINLFATSREDPEIEKQFKGSIMLPIRASKGDVERYLTAHLNQLPSFVLKNEQPPNQIAQNQPNDAVQTLPMAIVDTISDCVDGM